MKGILAVEGRLSKSTGRQLDGPSPPFRGRMVTLRQFKNAHQPKDCGSLREGPSGKAGAMVRSGQHDTSTRPRGSWARSPCLLGPVLVRKENKKKLPERDGLGIFTSSKTTFFTHWIIAESPPAEVPLWVPWHFRSDLTNLKTEEGAQHQGRFRPIRCRSFPAYPAKKVLTRRFSGRFRFRNKFLRRIGHRIHRHP